MRDTPKWRVTIKKVYEWNRIIFCADHFFMLIIFLCESFFCGSFFCWSFFYADHFLCGSFFFTRIIFLCGSFFYADHSFDAEYGKEKLTASDEKRGKKVFVSSVFSGGLFLLQLENDGAQTRDVLSALGWLGIKIAHARHAFPLLAWLVRVALLDEIAFRVAIALLGLFRRVVLQLIPFLWRNF